MCEFPNYFLRLKDKYDIKYQLTGYRSKLIYLSSVSNVEKGNYKLSYNKDKYDLIVRDCGQCRTCRYKRARSKAVQVQSESKCHKDNCFITLTFGDEKIYDYFITEGYSRATANRKVKLLTWTLEKKLFQKFMKSLRFKIEQSALEQFSKEKGYFDNYIFTDKNGHKCLRNRIVKKKYYDYSDFVYPKIKFYHCGEYGEKNHRPHHHAIILGWKPPKDDVYFENQYSWKRKRNEKVQRSKILNSIWKFGNNQVGSATYQSMNYVARYCTKKIKGRMCETYYNGRLPEYETASNREGLGAQDFVNNVYQYLSNRGIPYKDVDGNIKLAPLPNYFKTVLRRYFPQLYGKFSYDCYEYSKKYNNLTPSQLLSKARKQSINTAGIDSLCGHSEFKSDYSFSNIESYILYESIKKREIFGSDNSLNTYRDLKELFPEKSWRQKMYDNYELSRKRELTRVKNALIDYKFKHNDSDFYLFNIKVYQNIIDEIKNRINPYTDDFYKKSLSVEHLVELLC